jgi:histidinol dehydrogenase
MRFLNTQTTRLAELRSLFAARLSAANLSAEETVRSILDDVRQRGDAALLDHTRRFDFPRADAVRVSEAAISGATERVQRTNLWPVMQQAAERIRRFHEPQRRASWMDASRPGETLGQIIRPLRRVGIYVPGGTAAYPSTVLMTAIPAAVAGVEHIALTTPPNRETGLPPDATLAACRLAGVTEVYAVGGAQAIAGLAYGTESIEPVDKVVGPGSLYANLAKRMVYGVVGIDMLAGPSEVAVLADDAADPASAAADILTQCEHDPNSSALIATPAASFAAAVREEMSRQLEDLPRADIARRALECAGFAVVTSSLDEAAEVVNLYAPEHLHVDVREPWAILGRITNAGAILVGRHTSAPLGDYLAGPSHTLPTAGCARYASPLNVDDFVKKTSVLYFDEAAAGALSESAAVFAEFEGLEGHARAARRSMGTGT